MRLPVFRIDRSEGGAQTVELYDYFYPFTPPPDESRQDTGGRIWQSLRSKPFCFW